MPDSESNPDVLRVQGDLRAHEYPLGTSGPTGDGRDGTFGPMTRDAMLAALVDLDAARDEATQATARGDSLTEQLGTTRAQLDELRDELAEDEDEDIAGLVRLGRTAATFVADAGRFSESA